MDELGKQGIYLQAQMGKGTGLTNWGSTTKIKVNNKGRTSNG